MSVVSINVCGYFIYLYGCWVISSFFLSIHVSMAGVLYTMVSCTDSCIDDLRPLKSGQARLSQFLFQKEIQDAQES